MTLSQKKKKKDCPFMWYIDFNTVLFYFSTVFRHRISDHLIDIEIFIVMNQKKKTKLAVTAKMLFSLCLFRSTIERTVYFNGKTGNILNIFNFHWIDHTFKPHSYSTSSKWVYLNNLTLTHTVQSATHTHTFTAPL